MSDQTTRLLVADPIGVVDQELGARHWGVGIAPCFATFALGSIAQGAPFVLIAAALERRDVGSGWLAAVAAVRLAPYLVCSPMAGAIAGRYEARRVFAVTGLARAIVIVALGISVVVEAPVGVPLALLFALVAFGTPGFPALMRVVHRTTPPARLDRASTFAAGVESAAFCAGPALGGLLLVVADAAGSLLVCAAMMLVSVGLASSLRTIRGTTPLADGLRDQRIRTAGRVLPDPRLRPAIVAVLGVNVLAGLDAGLDLGGERAFGVLSFAHGAGAVAAFGALVGPMPRGRHPLLPLVTAGVGVGVLAATSELSVAIVACFALGASILTAEAVVTSALGRTLPASVVAPAFGVLDASMVAAMIAGAVLAPLLTLAVGLRPTLLVAGIGTPLLAVGARRRRTTGHVDRGSQG